VEAIRENLAALQVGPRATVLAGPVLLTLKRCAAELVFLDPPYEMEREYTAALEILAEGSPELVVVQHSVRHSLEESYGALKRTRVVKQGDNALSFFKADQSRDL
jgi:16S rRNA (guanine966-N2)-methyltransferase